MNLDKNVRWLVTAVLVLLTLLIIAATLFVTESALNVIDRLRESPVWLRLLVAAGFVAIAAVSVRVAWFVLRPRRAEPEVEEAPEPVNRDSLDARIASLSAEGVDTSTAQAELAELAARKEAGFVQVALFGTISTGKSSIIKALLPADADSSRVSVSVRGGSTREVTDYEWTSPASDRLILTDVPGLSEAGGELDELAREEAIRAHAVIFVCDGDLTQDEFNALKALQALDKPVILALNKMDQLGAEDLAVVSERLEARAAEAGVIQPQVVNIAAAQTERVVRLLPGGGEQAVTRAVEPRVDALRSALQGVIDEDGDLLESLRDSSAFWLASQKLDVAERAHRRERSAQIVKSYTGKAVVGALAAVAPGTDILIQGYLGTGMVRELCEVYGAPVSDVDLQRFLDLAQAHVGKAAPLLLAIAGNGLKAFPGVGTVAGGLMHAVAYGLIFDAMGNSLAATLDTSGQLRPGPAAKRFSEQLGEDIPARTQRIARLALEAQREKPKD
ncbi:MAG: GTPase [Pseudomonadota bacterium]